MSEYRDFLDRIINELNINWEVAYNLGIQSLYKEMIFKSYQMHGNGD